MKIYAVFILLILMFSLSGCGVISGKHGRGTFEEEWCNRDEEMPWSGCWREIARIDCITGEEFESDESISELRLRSDGRFSITWHPFESFTDFSGSYNINEIVGSITFEQIDRPGYDGEGFYLILDNEDMVLLDMWFGFFYKDASFQTEAAACGYVFRSK